MGTQNKAVELLHETNTTLSETIESQQDNFERIKIKLEDLNKICEKKQQKIDALMSKMKIYKKSCETQIRQLTKNAIEKFKKINDLEEKISELKLSKFELEQSINTGEE